MTFISRINPLAICVYLMVTIAAVYIAYRNRKGCSDKACLDKTIADGLNYAGKESIAGESFVTRRKSIADSVSVQLTTLGHTSISKNFSGFVSSKAIQWFLFAAILLSGCLVRVFDLAGFPAGLHQDEASIGYEAYSLANFGVDRNGYSYPVYPITYGCGGGSPLMIYLNALSSKLFGSSVTVLRGTTAFFGCLTLVLFYLILRKLWNNKVALFGMFVLAFNPWHIMLSRWSLDSNTMPFWLCLATLVFIHATDTHKTLHYSIAAGLYALCLYSYGSANIIVPLNILLICTYCIKKKVLKPAQLIPSAIAFIIVSSPLILFYAINYLGLPEIQIGPFSVEKFTSNRIGNVFIALDKTFPSALWSNFKYLILSMTTGGSNESIVNFIPGFSTLFEFTFPVTFLGIGVSCYNIFKKGSLATLSNRETEVHPADLSDTEVEIHPANLSDTEVEIHPADLSDTEERGTSFQRDAIIMSLLFSSAFFALIAESDINRLVMIYIPLIYFMVVGFVFIYRHSKVLFGASSLVLAISCLLFVNSYFTEYNDISSYIFMPGLGEATQYANELCKDSSEKFPESSIIVSKDNASAPYMITLFYTKESPIVFNDTVIYEDDSAEFRMASSFDNFIFGLPDDLSNEIDTVAEAVVKANNSADAETVATANNSADAETVATANNSADAESATTSNAIGLINGDRLAGNIYVVSSRQKSAFNPETCSITEFGNYAVIAGK